VSEPIEIAGHKIGPGNPSFIIAEAGVNHNGDLALALKLVDVAVNAGADAVKFQTFRAESIATDEAPKAAYQLATTAAEQSQLEMLRQLELSKSAHHTLKSYCDQLGITFLSTPFDEESADFLETLNVPAYKVSSGDLTNLPLIQHVSRKGKPVIISTGMATLEEVDQAVVAAREAGVNELVLLHCVSNYPAEPSEINLRAMKTMEEEFSLPIGFSDHSDGIEICLAAVALGAVVIEKHFTLDRNMPGPDHRASLEPTELASMVKGIRRVELSLGDGRKLPSDSEAIVAKVARRSIVAATSIKSGTLLQSESVVLKRPGSGLPPSMLNSLLGKRARRDIPAGTMIDLEMFD
jgi:N,N'-diacetyllegionaminate synthase